MSAKTAIEEVFTKPLADLIWTANTLTVYPATLQSFAVGSVLPAVFYMFRRGHRRGRGRFQDTFSPGPKMRPNIFSAAGRLSQEAKWFEGFNTELAKDILGDLLLCDALENKGHAEGHHVEVQRAFPVHFFASWLDLPPSVGHLRFVPEMLVALLVDQPGGLKLDQAAAGDFSVGCLPRENLFFRVFARGVDFGANLADLRADSASEDERYSVEELLMIRIAQACNQAPERLKATRGASLEIQNLAPLAAASAGIFRDDLSAFLRYYGGTIPRRALTPMVETLIGLGICHTLLASWKCVLAWERAGVVPERNEQRPFPMLVDASSGSNTRLRGLSEQSIEEMVRFLDEATTALTMVRILDAKGRADRVLKDSRPTGPDSGGWLNQLGAVRFGRHERSEVILNDLSEKLNTLADRLEEEPLEGEALAILRSPSRIEDPVRVLAEAICSLMGEKLLRSRYLQFFDAALMANEPHGLTRKRRVSRVLLGGKRKMMDARSLVLSDTLLEALVHVHLAQAGGRLSYSEFLGGLRRRYGLCVCEAPPGLAASGEDLERNRAILERRLRDLGLLAGVNDAESMKYLRPRYHSSPAA